LLGEDVGDVNLLVFVTDKFTRLLLQKLLHIQLMCFYMHWTAHIFICYES